MRCLFLITPTNTNICSQARFCQSSWLKDVQDNTSTGRKKILYKREKLMLKTIRYHSTILNEYLSINCILIALLNIIRFMLSL